MDRLYAEALRSIGRLFAGFPRPRNIPYHDAEPVLEEVSRILSRSKSACLNTPPSAAVRLSLAAQRRSTVHKRPLGPEAGALILGMPTKCMFSETFTLSSPAPCSTNPSAETRAEVHGGSRRGSWYTPIEKM